MITLDNYQQSTTGINWAAMPEPLSKSHQMLVSVSRNFSDMERVGKNDTIQQLMTKYLDKLNAFMAEHGFEFGDKAEPKPKTAPAPKKAAKPKAEPKPKAQVKAKPAPKPAPAPKSEKKAAEKAKPQASFTYVPKYSEELKVVRAYLALHGKIRSKEQIAALARKIGRFEVEGALAAGAYRAEIKDIYARLKSLLSVMADTVKVEIAQDKRELYQAYSDSFKVYLSVIYLKRFIGIAGKTNVKHKAERLHKQIQKALDSGKIEPEDKYINLLKKAQAELTKYIDNQEQPVQFLGSGLGSASGLLGDIMKVLAQFGLASTGMGNLPADVKKKP